MLVDHVTVAAHRHLGGGRIGALILDPISDGLRLPDNAEARRGNERDAAVAFVLVSGNQRMDRSGEAQRCGVGRHVMDAAVGDHDHAGNAIGRNVGKRRAKRGEQTRAVGLAVGLSGFHRTDFEAGDVVQPLDDRGAGGFGLLGTVAETLAWAFVDDDDGDRVQRIAMLAGQRRIGERKYEQSQRQRSHDGAAAARHEKQQRKQAGGGDRRP